MQGLVPTPSRAEAVVKSLLQRPATKPDFSQQLEKPSVISQLRAFLPQFKASTEAMLADHGDHSMEIQGDPQPGAQFIEMVPFHNEKRRTSGLVCMMLTTRRLWTWWKRS